MNNLSQNKKNIMEIRELTFSAILIAFGFVLHSIVPPIFLGVKPDFLLSCMFVAFSLSKSRKNIISVCISCAIISALTTAFPGGQIPNIIDKISTGIFVFILLKLLKDTFSIKLKLFTFGLIVFVGTIFSGIVFLSSAFFIVGLPATFSSLLIAIVVPTAFANVFVGVLMYAILQKSKK